MIRITQHPGDIIELRDGRVGVAVRLIVWVAVVAIYYLGLIASILEPATGVGHGVTQWLWSNPGNWVLLLVPVALSPYLIAGVRALRRGSCFVFDQARNEVRRGRVLIGECDDIRRLTLSATNGTCEELLLSIDLAGGRPVPVYTSGDRAGITVFARELGQLLGVEVLVAPAPERGSNQRLA